MRVALYARVSTTQRKDGSTSWSARPYEQNPQVQLEPMRVYAQAQGWEVVADKGPHLEDGITDYFDRASGANPMRAAFGRLMVDVSRRRFDAVMCWKFDRMSRNSLHLIQTLDLLNEAGVGFISLTERIDTTTPMGRVMFSLIAAFAQFEREQIQERIHAGIASARKRGVRFGRPTVPVPVLLIEQDMDNGMSLTAAAKKRKIARETAARAMRAWNHQKSRQEKPVLRENSDPESTEMASSILG